MTILTDISAIVSRIGITDSMVLSILGSFVIEIRPFPVGLSEIDRVFLPNETTLQYTFMFLLFVYARYTKFIFNLQSISI